MTVESASNWVVSRYRKEAKNYEARGWDKRNAVLDVFYSMIDAGSTKESLEFFKQVKATVLKKTKTFKGKIIEEKTYRNHPFGL